MSTLPVREMILYKHGVGFFVREGTVGGEDVELTFRQDEINDVLKSLAVFDRAGGQVLGIHYQTPMDKAARLANSSIRLSDKASVRDLLRDLRGRRATLSFEITPGTIEMVSGRIIGIDEPDILRDNSLDPIAGWLVSVLAEDNQVRIFRLTTLRNVSIQDMQSDHDLQYFLDTSMGEDTRRTVAVRLGAGDHDLVVSYVAPSPTWRVSYRVIAESSENKEGGKALLQGWGLFDNRLEEDLENVSVTLVAGQPISFIYELYASRIPQRPTVQDQSRVAPGPVEFDAAFTDLADVAEERPTGTVLYKAMGGRAAVASPAMAAAPSPAAARRTVTMAQASQAAPPAAQAKEAGEFFQYEVTAPVSVKRGESALVPIIGSEVNYNRELLYNGSKLPNHPVAALRFANSTGLTLERGPVTLVEGGDYKGEAVVPFTKEDNEVYLPYAVELGVRVTERPEHRTQTAGLSIREAYLIYEEYTVQTVTYVVENTTNKPQTVTIEAPIQNGYEPFETAQPDVETASERRWRIKIPARSRSEFIRHERQRTQRYENLRNLNYQNLQNFLDNRWLDRTTLSQLKEMLDTVDIIIRAKTEQSELGAERSDIYKRQEQLRANLGTLNATGQEATLRNRILGQLEATQDRLEVIDGRLNELKQEIAQAEARVNEIIAALG